MLKRVLLLCAMILVFQSVPANAGPKVTCQIHVAGKHDLLVTLVWEVTVQSEKAWDACDLIISFEDEAGRELHAVRQTLQIKAGASAFSGHEICDSAVWKRVRKYVTTLDCVF